MLKVSLLFLLGLVALSTCQEEPAPKEKPFKPPSHPAGDVYFTESFSDGEEVWSRWIKSEATKDGADADIAKYDGDWELKPMQTEGAFAEDIGLILTEAAKHYAVSAKLDKPFNFESTDTFIVQYEVNFQNGLTCGGAYIKLLAAGDGFDLTQFNDQTPYSIMFGPDKCGLSSKVHFILRFKNPVTGKIEEKHSKQAEDGKMDFFTDKKTHLFTLMIYSDSTYLIAVDQMPFLKGNLLKDLTPPLNPPMEIDDPDDKMPADWDEREEIPDPETTKPDDWDENAPQKISDPDAVKPEGWLDDGPEYIPDPAATLPEDWDEEEDGEWEPSLIASPACEEVGCGHWSPPMIQNPNYKGTWKPPMIPNPDYGGKWAPRKIENPEYFSDETPYFSLLPIEAVGFELWSMSENIYFDNVIVTSELTVANNYAIEGWMLKMEKERHVGGSFAIAPWLDTFVELANTYPYLWALYAVAIVMPFVLCAACCVKSKPKPQDEAARKKKTDEPTPDDPQDKPAADSQTIKEEQSFVAEEEENVEEGGASQDEEKEGSQSGGASQGEESQGEGEEGSQAEGEEGSQAEGEEGSQAEGEEGSQVEGEEGSQAEGEEGSQAEGDGSPVEGTEEVVPELKKDEGHKARRRKKNRRED